MSLTAAVRLSGLQCFWSDYLGWAFVHLSELILRPSQTSAAVFENSPSTSVGWFRFSGWVFVVRGAFGCSVGKGSSGFSGWVFVVRGALGCSVGKGSSGFSGWVFIDSVAIGCSVGKGTSGFSGWVFVDRGALGCSVWI